MEEKKTIFDDFFNKNTPLVVTFAKRYQNRGLEFADLVQYGNEGLMKGISKFDWRRGYTFSTYATWWIVQTIVRGIKNDSRSIRIPIHIAEECSQLKNTQKQLILDLEREPTPRELATFMGISKDKVMLIMQCSQQIFSLNAKVGEKENMELGELLDSEDQEACEDEAIKGVVSEEMKRVLAALPPRERYILELKFGLDDGKPQNLAEIGRSLNLTRERVRQIEAKALSRLRSLPEIMQMLPGSSSSD